VCYGATCRRVGKVQVSYSCAFVAFKKVRYFYMGYDAFRNLNILKCVCAGDDEIQRKCVCSTFLN
jgi:hypothetical protein